MAIEILREVEGILIPAGDKITLKPPATAFVTQALGTAYTVQVSGHLIRIAGKDGDALGLPQLVGADINEMPGSTTDKVWTQLATCYDPEISVNIVALGLIYECEVAQDFSANITMTLTAPTCGMGPILVREIEEKILLINEIKQANINLVFDPPWDKEMMSDEAKLQLGLM